MISGKITTNSKFDGITDEITSIGLNWHSQTLVENSINNKKYFKKTIREISLPKGKNQNLLL